jgi:thiamine-phosphate pyrophosphorylase
VGPVLCLITSPSQGTRDEIGLIRAAARAGVQLVQVRKPGWEARDLTELVAAAVAVVRGTAARVLVNDRVDVALAAGAAGVHLRSDSAPPSRVRAMTPPGFLIGRSVHRPEEAARVAAERSVDYLLFGTVFPTPSKPGVEGTGTAVLASVCRQVPVPVLAIGGVTAKRFSELAAAGAAGFAAIGLFADGGAGSIAEVVRAARRAYETARGNTRLPE